MTRSPLIWFGGKAKYAELIINKMPGHKVYVEPFGGAAHVIAHKPKGGHEVYNDIDGNVVNFLMQVRKNPKAMQSKALVNPFHIVDNYMNNGKQKIFQRTILNVLSGGFI